jgi:hypothetical protein
MQTRLALVMCQISQQQQQHQEQQQQQQRFTHWQIKSQIAQLSAKAVGYAFCICGLAQCRQSAVSTTPGVQLSSQPTAELKGGVQPG